MSIHETLNKLIPVLFVGGFFNPALERFKCINCDLRGIRKQELEVLHNKILVVEKGSSDLPNLVTVLEVLLPTWFDPGWGTFLR